MGHLQVTSRAASYTSKVDRPAPVRSLSDTSDLNKPLPTLSVWGRLATGTDRVKHHTNRKLSFPGRSQVPEARWRRTVKIGAIIAVTILLVNIALLVYAFTKPLDELTKTRIVAEGPCQATQGLFTIAQLIINGVSTILLATSNATMQCLVAPSREAVNSAHSRGTWLDVGVPSFRNWPYVERWRKWCWAVLMLSSLPLHLLYNSVMFTATSANEYFAFAVPSNFLDVPIITSDESQRENQAVQALVQLARSDELVRMDNKACIDAYGQDFVTVHSNVLIVTKNVSSELILAGFEVFPTPLAGTDSIRDKQNAWLCGDPERFSQCDMDWLSAHPENFNLSVPLKSPSQSDRVASNGFGSRMPVDHCLLQETVPSCTLQFTTDIMIVVILCNVLKVACFLIAARVQFQPLITLGDAIESFIKQPDPHTSAIGPASAGDVREAIYRARHFDTMKRKGAHVEEAIGRNSNILAGAIRQLKIQATPLSGTPKMWFKGADADRWCLAYLLLGGMWAIGVLVVGYIVRASGGIGPVIAQFQANGGFSNVSTNFLMAFTTSAGTFGNIILANTLHLLLSLIYFCYNALLTSIIMSHEFTKYARKRATLRVSVPKGHQKSSHWFSLPFRFAIPLLFLSANLHWGLSQSIFLAEVRTNTPEGSIDFSRSISCLGYSPLALMVTLSIGAVLVVAPLAMGFKRFIPGAPIVESNSIAISAACHMESENVNEHLEFLKYGIEANVDGRSIGFSSMTVLPLQPGQNYGDFQFDHEMQSVRFSHQQKILMAILGVLNIAKLVLACIWIFLGPSNSETLHTFVPEALASLDIIVSPSMIALLIYIVLRSVVSAVRWRKHLICRRFVWHVTPEAFFCVSFFVITAINFPYAQPSPDDISSSTPHSHTLVNAFLAWCTSLTALFFVSTGIETLLWRQQFWRGGISTLRSWIPSNRVDWKKTFRIVH